MKMKKMSILGLILASTLVVGITTVFATGALAKGVDVSKDGVYLAGTMNGKNYIYTDDGGSTWITEIEYKAQNPDIVNNLEFWEVNEFESWMELQKFENQKLVDEKSKSFYFQDPETDEWTTRVWTQQDVDELYTSWQKQLELMKKGYRYTKDIELSDGGLLVGNFEPGTLDSIISSGSSTVITFKDGTTLDLGHFDTFEDAEDAVRTYLDNQVKDGIITQQEANEILKNKATK